VGLCRRPNNNGHVHVGWHASSKPNGEPEQYKRQGLGLAHPQTDEEAKCSFPGKCPRSANRPRRRGERGGRMHAMPDSRAMAYFLPSIAQPRTQRSGRDNDSAFVRGRRQNLHERSCGTVETKFPARMSFRRAFAERAHWGVFRGLGDAKGTKYSLPPTDRIKSGRSQRPAAAPRPRSNCQTTCPWPLIFAKGDSCWLG